MRTRTLFAILAGVSLLMAGCGGGSTPAAPPPAPRPTASPPVTADRTVTVRVLLPSGSPAAGAKVAFLDSRGTWTATTDAAGNATQELAGTSAIVYADAGGDYYQIRVELKLESPTSSTTLTLERVRTLAVLAAEPAVSNADRSRVKFTLEIAVVTADGQPQAGLTASDFVLEPTYCGFGCQLVVENALGQSTRDEPMLPEGVTGVAWLPGAATVVEPLAILLDQAPPTDWMDPTRQRAVGVKAFLTALGTQPVALAGVGEAGASLYAPQPLAPAPAATLVSGVDAIVADTGRAPSLYRAIADIAASATPTPRTLIVVAGEGDDESCVVGGTASCRQRLDAAIAAARANGVRVVALGYGYRVADLALRTGGAFVRAVALVDSSVDRRQPRFGSAFAALPALLDGSVPRYRVTFDARASPGFFEQGGTLYGYVDVAVAAGTVDTVGFAVPIL